MPRPLKVYTGAEVSEIGVKEIFDRSIRKFGIPANQAAVLTKSGNTETNPDVYQFQNPLRGFGIVICIENFPGAKLNPRPYAQDELDNMNEMCTKLEFLPILFTDLSTRQIVDVLTEAASRKEVNCISDTFACVIGSHGNELEAPKTSSKDKKKRKVENLQYFHHVVYGTDGPLLTNDLLQIFEDAKCPELKGKPKLFFIQACRSRVVSECKADMGVNVQVVDEKSILKLQQTSRDQKETGDGVTATKPHNTHSGSESADESIPIELASDDDTDAETDGSDKQSEDDIQAAQGDIEDNKNIKQSRNIEDSKEGGCLIPMIKFKLRRKKKKKLEKLPIYAPYCPNNFFVMFATSEEKFAYGRDGQGGWMLYSMNKVIQGTTNISKVEFLTLMTIVSDVVATLFATNAPTLQGAKTAVTFEHRLIGDIYFTRKHPV